MLSMLIDGRTLDVPLPDLRDLTSLEVAMAINSAAGRTLASPGFAEQLVFLASATLASQVKPAPVQSVNVDVGLLCAHVTARHLRDHGGVSIFESAVLSELEAYPLACWRDLADRTAREDLAWATAGLRALVQRHQHEGFVGFLASSIRKLADMAER